MDTISQLKAIAKEHELDGLENINLQLEVMRAMNAPEIQRTLDKILELALIEPSIIAHFIEGFQKTAAAFTAGKYVLSDAESMSSFIDDQAKRLQNENQ